MSAKSGPFKGSRAQDSLLDARPVSELDLHGFSALEVSNVLRGYLGGASKLYAGKVVHIITGRGRGSRNGAVLKPLVARLLRGELRHFITDHSIDVDEGGFLIRVR